MRYRWVVALAVLLMVPAVLSLADRSASAAPDSYSSEELEFLEIINDYRADRGLEPLVLSDTIAVAAERHSKDMAAHHFFAHDTLTSSYYPDGSEPWDRMAAEGYDYNTYMGENLAVGYRTAEEAFEAWRESPGHNANMLNEEYRVVGISRVHRPDSLYDWYWTTDFGGFVDPSAHAPGQSPSPENEASQQEPSGDREEARERESRGSGIENGGMESRSGWRQRARDGAELILDEGKARLGGYRDGRDVLRQRVRIGDGEELTFRMRVMTQDRQDEGDRLVVRLTDREGEKVSRLGTYTAADAGGWRRESVDLSRFAGREVYLTYTARTNEEIITSFYLDDVALR